MDDINSSTDQSTTTSSPSSSGDEAVAPLPPSSKAAIPHNNEQEAATARPSLARFRWETDSWLKNSHAWDLSGAKELSNLVKAGTAEAHRTVESSPMVG